MRDRFAELGERTDVVLITFTEPSALAGYRDRNALPFPVVTDPNRHAYRAYGLGRGSVARVWGWRAGLRYVQILRRSGLRAWRRPTEDTLQLGGDFVIDPDGTLIYGFWGRGPDDRPRVEDLITAVNT